MRPRARAAWWSAVLSVTLVVVVTVSAGIGSVDVPAPSVAKILLNALAVPTGVQVVGTVGGLPLQVPALALEWTAPFDFHVDDVHATIIMSVRLPRVLLGAVVGFALAAAGAIMQGFFRNPMADPSIIGVSSGAAVGAVAVIVVSFAVPFGLGVRAAAFVGALVAAFGVYLIATEGRTTPVATLLLAGVAVQTFLGAVVSFLLLRSGESIRRVVFWLMGHLQNTTYEEVLVTGLLVPAVFLPLSLYANDLNALMLGEEDARSLGVEVERTKRILLAGSSVITAAAVAVSGIIGFVGLIVPHMVRLVVGPDHRVLLPASALGGASFLVLADALARGATATALPVGIVTAAVGAPFFLYLLRKREVHSL
jgi:iron complex transport system permease protein